MIKKLSDIHQSEKEYLKVCSSITQRYVMFCIVFSHLNHLIFLTKMAEVWLQLLQIKEEEAVDRKELLQLWKEMAQLLQDCMKDAALDIKAQQHVRFPNIEFAFGCVLIHRGLKDFGTGTSSTFALCPQVAQVFCCLVKTHQICFPLFIYFICLFVCGR